MSRTHVVIPDPHAHYQHHNRRAEWAGKLIADIKPDVVVVGGDLADMPSLSGYDKGKKSFQGRTYRADIDAAHDFNDRLWSPVRKTKKKQPEKHVIIGNHEWRIPKAINLQPELEGTISLKDLEYEYWYDEVTSYYNTRDPGVVNIDGINYAHFFVSGVMGKPIGGQRPASAILAKRHESCTAFDLHLVDYFVDNTVSGKIQGLVAGCFQDYDSDWAGQANKLWWRGLIVKRNVENGNYDPQFISLENLRKEYGS